MVEVWNAILLSCSYVEVREDKIRLKEMFKNERGEVGCKCGNIDFVKKKVGMDANS